MTNRLIVLYNCIKFHSNSFNGFKFTVGTQNRIANDQTEIPPKITSRDKNDLFFDTLSYCALQLYKVSFKLARRLRAMIVLLPIQA